MHRMMQSYKKLYTRSLSNVCANVSCELVNKNPRNLEKLRIARKPTGFHLDKPGKTFWHRLTITQKSRYVIASVSHNNGNTIIQASSNELGISKHLYRCNDINAYINLANVLAERCIESGITEMMNGVNGDSPKRNAFIEHFENAGISLKEPSNYTPITPWSRIIHEKPWQVHV